MFERRFFDNIYKLIKEHEYKPKERVNTYTAKGVFKTLKT